MSELKEVPGFVIGLSRVNSRLRELQDYARDEKSGLNPSDVRRLISQITELANAYYSSRDDINSVSIDPGDSVLRTYKKFLKPVLEYAKANQPDYQDIVKDFKQLEKGWDDYKQALVMALKTSTTASVHCQNKNPLRKQVSYQMGIHAASRQLAIAGIKHIVISAEGFDRKSLHEKLKELMDITKTWQTNPHGISAIEAKCQEITALLNATEDSFPVSSGTRESVVAALRIVTKNLFGTHLGSAKSKGDQEIVRKFKRFVSQETKFIDDIKHADSITEFCAAVAFVIKSYVYHMNQYLNEE